MKVTHRVFRLVVDGSFPIDMLRYDQCAPQTSTDAASMAEYQHDRRAVGLYRYHPDATSKPAAERWESFGWRVVSDEPKVS